MSRMVTQIIDGCGVGMHQSGYHGGSSGPATLAAREEFADVD